MPLGAENNPVACRPQSCMLVVANNLLDAESTVKADEREKYLAEKCPPLELPYSKDELQVRHERPEGPTRRGRSSSEPGSGSEGGELRQTGSPVVSIR